MAEQKEYIATSNTFVDGVLKREGTTFFSDRKPSKAWKAVKPEPEESDDGKQSVKEVVAAIAESTDLNELAALKEDSRKTVRTAAEKRIAELAGSGPAPGGE